MHRFLICVTTIVMLATSLQAQDATTTESTSVDAAIAAEIYSDLEQWNSVANRIEAAIEANRASDAVLGQVRGELTQWRDTFLHRESENSQRIATVEAQVAALGAVPESGEENARIANRRAELTAQLQALQAPVILAREAYTQANGMISELDSLLRERQADRFAERNQSPLNPAAWVTTATALKNSAITMGSEVSNAINSDNTRSQFWDVLPVILVLLAVATVLVLRGRAWYNQMTQMVVGRSGRAKNVLGFFLSLGQIIVPFIGLVALSYALTLSGFLGEKLSTVVAWLPSLGLFPIFAHWIAGQLTPYGLDEVAHPLSMDPKTSNKAHRRFIVLGYAIMLYDLARSIVDVNALEVVPASVTVFPFGFLLAWGLYRFGHLLGRTSPAAEDDLSRSFRSSIRKLLSRGIMLAAVAGVVLACLGYSNAFEITTFPAAFTIYLAAVLLMLQRLSVDIYTLLSKSEGGADNALIPVLIGFLLILVSLPLVALIWGAQVTDITEMWAKFREGFSIGETRISPTSFLMFALVFAVGFMATRLVQSALRTTVLPRTKVDPGGQTAIVSGMGYVGVFLAAVIAITTAGIDLSGLAIVAGALSVGIGFGLQNIVSNFISGIILLIERPISQGDWIEVGGQMGYVRDISVRSTRIETFDRTDVIVPNADLISNQVINWTRGNNVGRVIVPVGVAYGTDTDRITAILKEIAEAHPMVLLSPGPSVVFQGFGADSLDFEIRAILRDVNYVLSVKSEMNHAIAKKFVAEGIEIPFGQRDIWLRNPEALNFGARPSRKTTSTSESPSGDDKTS